MEISRRKLVVAGATLGITGLAVGLSRGLAKEPSEGAADKEGKKDKEAKHKEEVSPVEDLMREHGAFEADSSGLRRKACIGCTPTKICLRKPLLRLPGLSAPSWKTTTRSWKKTICFLALRRRASWQTWWMFSWPSIALGGSSRIPCRGCPPRRPPRTPTTERRWQRRFTCSSVCIDPHAAREDTVLFPALHGIVSAHEYDSLGEDFEKKEQQLFGADGFEKMVDRIAVIEKSLGIYDLALIHSTGVMERPL